jgi:hypothetical protein
MKELPDVIYARQSTTELHAASSCRRSHNQLALAVAGDEEEAETGSPTSHSVQLHFGCDVGPLVALILLLLLLLLARR